MSIRATRDHRLFAGEPLFFGFIEGPGSAVTVAQCNRWTSGSLHNRHGKHPIVLIFRDGRHSPNKRQSVTATDHDNVAPAGVQQMAD